MKLRYWLLLIPVFLILVWILSILYAGGLTLLWGQEFSNTSAIGMDWWSWTSEDEVTTYRILWLTPNRATVYFCTDDYGELNTFEKQNGKWVFVSTTSSWSDDGGSADDYFIWPYFKNYVV